MRNYSVLMAVYHKEEPEYLRQAIESIQVQTVPTNDFVLVCDGPLNPELDAVIATKKQEMGNTLNVVRLAKNCGLGNALNEGMPTNGNGTRFFRILWAADPTCSMEGYRPVAPMVPVHRASTIRFRQKP